MQSRMNGILLVPNRKYLQEINIGRIIEHLIFALFLPQ